MSYRRLLTIALIAGLPQIGQAQFTTFIPPKDRVVDSVKTVVAAQQKAKVDSSIKTQLTNMKTWVDSAAGLPAIPHGSAANDSLAAAAPPTPALPTAPLTPTTPMAPTKRAPAMSVPDTTFTNGARAPATATDLPMLLVLGGLMVFVGATLAGVKPKPERVRADRGDPGDTSSRST